MGTKVGDTRASKRSEEGTFVKSEEGSDEKVDEEK